MTSTEHTSEQRCPQCDNHCPADALQCGRGRRYFGIEGEEHGHDHGGRPEGSLSGLLQQCGRFIHHEGRSLEERDLFRALTEEEQASLRTLLEKLSAGWKQSFGDSHGHNHGHDHGGEGHHKHGGHGR